MNKKIKYVISVLRESFVELLPYMVLMSILIISIQLISIFHLDLLDLQNNLISFVEIISKFLSILLIIIISVNIAKIYRLNISVSITISLLVYVLFNLLNNNYKFELQGLLTINTLAIPFLSLKFLNILLKLKLFKSNLILNPNLKDIFTLIFPSSIIIIFTSIFLYYINYIVESNITYVSTYIEALPSDIFLFLYNLFSNLFWFIGIHGVTAAALFFDHSILQNTILPNISNDNFMNLFTVFGGAGSGLALAIAILINGKNEHWNKISKLAMPFVIFNINEILIYGLPIVFNRYLFLPFVFVPLINFILAYNIISLKIVEFTVIDVHWAMPTFINAYLATNGNIGALLLQLFLLTVSVLIYLPFVNKYANLQNTNLIDDKLKKSLDLSEDLYTTTSSNDEQIQLINKNTKINQIIQLINNNELLMSYQAKIDIQNNKSNNFEALLRLKYKNGIIESPYFLKYLENDEYMISIDYWVAKEIKKQFINWRKNDFYPIISMNLHPITLKNKEIILKIIDIFQNENIQFEVIEKNVLNEDAKNNILLLSKSGFKIVIDDFGVGYSNLLSIYENSIAIIKIDKKLIDKIYENEVYLICNYIANLCYDLGIDVVAEGVETQKQVDLIKQTKIKYIQGYFYTKAIPADKIKDFKINFESKSNL